MLLSLLLVGIAYSLHVIEAEPCHTRGLVCGTDGKTYKTICHLERATLTTPDLQVLYAGSCYKTYKSLTTSKEDEPVTEPNIQPTKRLRCTMIGSPVCGTDGRTYGNKCLLAYNAMYDSTLALKHYGKCKKHARNTEERNSNITKKRKQMQEISINIKNDANNINNVDTGKKPGISPSETEIDIKNDANNENNINIGIRTKN